MTAGTPCSVCTGSARAGRREPLIVDDVRTWSRMWRCSRCGTLWMEGNLVAAPLSESDADDELPGWRERERWLARTTMRTLLEEYRAGLLGDELFALALMHHDVLTAGTEASDLNPLILYSSAESALAGGQDPATLSCDSIAHRLRWTSDRRRVLLDPASPWGCELNAYVVEYLDANGRSTETESDRRREAVHGAG